MAITTREREGVTILGPQGHLTIGGGDTELRDAIQTTLGFGKTKILIDLGSAKRVDSSGMAELVAGLNAVNDRGGSLKLLNLPTNIRNPLEISQLVTVFDVFDDESEALASFG